MQKRKYVVVLGSLLSGLGKGVVTASIGKLLQSRGFRVVPIKLDGYLNVDCGTMNPYRHGEVFVLDDGAECDMDLGTYERFLDIDLNRNNNITGGKVFNLVIGKERRGEYLGYDVQFVPHVTNEIKKWVRRVGDDAHADVVLVEVGGTVGDIENSYFVEALRQLGVEERGSVLFAQLTYVPMLESVGEQKTKPTQHATRLLLGLGIQPDVIICRSSSRLKADARKKLALYCNVEERAIVDDPDIGNIYELPRVFEEQGLADYIAEKLALQKRKPDMRCWNEILDKAASAKKGVVIGITGKYTALRDAYASIKEAIAHAAAHLGVSTELRWIETTDIESGRIALGVLDECDAIIVPGGFGERGAEGKISCIKYARENKIPYLGLCLGLQLAVVEWARNVCGLRNANSTEIDPKTPHPIIDILPEQKRIAEKGATMRLGAYEAVLKRGTRAHAAYGSDKISERHRHRYEVNPKYMGKLQECGLVISGTSPDGRIVETVEWPGSFGIATQAHPEFKSRFEKPAPLFVALLKESMSNTKPRK